MQRSIGKSLTAILLLALSAIATAAVNNQTCGIVPGQPLNAGDYGPFDYTDPSHQKYRPLVENPHFPKEVESLTRKNASGDIDYTLGKFPNHHRALYAMMRAQKANRKVAGSQVYTMECYFKRAIYFRPNDATVHMLNGMYYHWNSRLDESEEKYLDALELQPNDPQIHYNLGLLYFDKGDYANAATHAEAAYNAGHPLEGLRKKLRGVDIPVTE